MSELVQQAMDDLVQSGAVPGWSAAIRRGDQVWTGSGGVLDLDTGEQVTAETVFRVASLSKPIGAVLALQAIERGEIELEAPIAAWVPELADLRVWAGGDRPLTDTTPAERPVTVWHLLTMTAGWGFSAGGDPLDEALFASAVAPGATAPSVDGSSGYLSALGALPLAFQPGGGWRYHNCTDVLAVLLERAIGQDLDIVLTERLTEPLGLTSMGFWAAADRPVATSYFVAMPDEPPLPGEGFRSRPIFLSLAAGLGSTASDCLTAFEELHDPQTVSSDLTAAATSPQLDPAQVSSAAAMLGEGASYGFQVSVNLHDLPRRGAAGAFRWSGGTGCEALCDPATGTTAVLLTNAGMTPEGEPEASAAFFDALFA